MNLLAADAGDVVVHRPARRRVDVVTGEPLPGQTFLYRYRNLRLLIQGGDRLFLIPPEWTPSNSTLVVPMDDSVRLQFRFQNSPP